MRTITVTTAFKMPLHGVSFSLSAHPVSSTVFRNTEKLSCANEVSVSKQDFYKGLLLPDRNLAGHKVRSFANSQGVDFLFLEKLYHFSFAAAKSGNGLPLLFLPCDKTCA